MQQVINLKRRNDRLREFESRWPHKYRKPVVYAAMDGQKIPNGSGLFEYAEQRVLQEHLIRSFNIAKLQKGEFACFVSHVSLWMKLAQMPEPSFFVIFEDDAQFGPVFEEKYILGWKFMQENVNRDLLLQMGGGPFQMKYSNDSNLKPVAGYPISQGLRALVTHAYALTSGMARILVSNIFQTQLDQKPIDVWMTNFFRKYPQYCYSMNPLISYSLPFWGSDIQTVWDKVFRVSRTDLVQQSRGTNGQSGQ